MQSRTILGRGLTALLALTFLLAAGAGAQTTKWVDAAGGSDANDGNSEASAYATLQFAIDNSTSGTAGTPSVIHVKDGTYGTIGLTNIDGFDTAILVASLDNLVIQAVDGHEPVIAPVTAVAANIVTLSIESSENVTIDNLDSDQTTAQFDGWHVSDADGLTVRNCLFEGGEDGIDFNTAIDDLLIEGCTFRNIDSGSGDEVLDFSDADVTNSVIQDCLFEDNYRHIRTGAPGVAMNLVIRRNVFDGTVATAGGSAAPQEALRLIGADGVEISNNLILNNAQQGLYIDSGCANITVVHNTFYNNDQEGAGANGEIRSKVFSSDIVVKNNIIHGNGLNEAFETATSLPSEDHNLIFATMDSFTFGPNTIFGDPLFADTTPGSEDLSITPGSPAEGAGEDLGVTTDVNGSERPCPEGTMPDIGGTELGTCGLTAAGVTLSLEAATCQQDQDAPTADVQIAVELWLRNPDMVEVTGWQAFLDFDEATMEFESAISEYDAGSSFSSHITSMGTAEMPAGKLSLDGNTFAGSMIGPGASTDELLATLYFTVDECTMPSVAFDMSSTFASEASAMGDALMTDLIDSPMITPDDTAPVIMGLPADITEPADAGACAGTAVTWTEPTAMDNCDPAPSVVCSPPSGSTFPVGTTTVTVTATDACGNQSIDTFDVTVSAMNEFDVTVVLQGSVAPVTRCIAFQTDCGAATSVELMFTGSPATAMATVELPCGAFTTLCAKDEQHTLYDSTTLTLSGTKYVADTTLLLLGGDTDDDGDVDINDVTLLLAQFGDLDAMSTCPWDGTRDADFSNNGAVGSEDYVFLTANWLETSACTCPPPSMLVGGGRDLRTSIPVRDAVTFAADLNRDGVVDVRDVELLEDREGLSGELSARMRSGR